MTLFCSYPKSYHKIPKLRSILRHGFVNKYDGRDHLSIEHLKQPIQASRDRGDKITTITFSTMERQAMHPIYGVQ